MQKGRREAERGWGDSDQGHVTHRQAASGSCSDPATVSRGRRRPERLPACRPPRLVYATLLLFNGDLFSE